MCQNVNKIIIEKYLGAFYIRNGVMIIIDFNELFDAVFNSLEEDKAAQIKSTISGIYNFTRTFTHPEANKVKIRVCMYALEHLQININTEIGEFSNENIVLAGIPD